MILIVLVHVVLCLKTHTCKYCIAVYSAKIFFQYPVFKFGISCTRGVALKWYCTGACGTNLKFGICGSLDFGRHQKTMSMQSCLRLPPLTLWPVCFLIITRKYLFGKSLIYIGICFRNKRFVIGFSKWQRKKTDYIFFYKCLFQVYLERVDIINMHTRVQSKWDP